MFFNKKIHHSSSLHLRNITTMIVLVLALRIKITTIKLLGKNMISSLEKLSTDDSESDFPLKSYDIDSHFIAPFREIGVE